ncbi:ferric-dicitrate binding protein FerR (iron transport regulator) [Chitinophaga sp. W3I9]
MAWKSGLFNFEGANLEEVMRQLERWYNIDVVYENGIPDIQFMGEMSRQISLTDLLEILRRTEVDFRVEGRKLIVLNK